jgi:hypothetical protein
VAELGRKAPIDTEVRRCLRPRDGERRIAGASPTDPGDRSLAAVSVHADGHPLHAELTPVSGFTRKAVADWASARIAPGSVVGSDGPSRINGVCDAGCVHHPWRSANASPAICPTSLGLNTVLGLRQDQPRRCLPRLRARQVRRALPRRHRLPIQPALHAEHDYATSARRRGGDRPPSGALVAPS